MFLLSQGQLFLIPRWPTTRIWIGPQCRWLWQDYTFDAICLFSLSPEQIITRTNVCLQYFVFIKGRGGGAPSLACFGSGLGELRALPHFGATNKGNSHDCKCATTLLSVMTNKQIGKLKFILMLQIWAVSNSERLFQLWEIIEQLNMITAK